MGAIDTVKDVISRLFGQRQSDNEEALFSRFPSTEGDRFEAREFLGDTKLEDDSGLALFPDSGQQDMVQSAGPGAGKEIGDMAEPEEQTNEDLTEAIAEVIRNEDQDPADRPEEGVQPGTGSEGYGGLPLDLFDLDDFSDEEETGLPEGLIDVDAGALLDECRRIAERLIQLPKGQSTLHQQQADGPNDVANESPGSDA